MITEHESLNSHDAFKELGCLASAGYELTPDEWSVLKSHLRNCEECSLACGQYVTLSTHGMPLLADSYSCPEMRDTLEDTTAWEKLFARVQLEEGRALSGPGANLAIARPRSLSRLSMGLLAGVALAACLFFAVDMGYRWGNYSKTSKEQIQVVASDNGLQKVATTPTSTDELLQAQAKRLSQLRQESSEKEKELAKLRLTLSPLEEHSTEITVANEATEESLRTVSQQRDTLIGQLQDAEAAYGRVQTELVNLRTEHEKVLFRTASLESSVSELAITNQDQAKKLKDDESFLAYDRDIRELMGARKLYIADVFDVDSHSHTEKTGRVFYTQGKSLIFYAFDLDHQPGVKNVGAFQAWGQKEASTGKPLNLGVFYLDSAANRRWVLHCDDPKQLAQIDAVFVTVEPKGGSDAPTGRQLLYASLRKEANHP